MSDILMPQLSDAMQEGTIVSWLKSDGEFVGVGDELFEVETDKATVTCAAEEAGVLDIVVPAGTSTAVGAPVGRLSSESPAKTAPRSEPTTGQNGTHADAQAAVPAPPAPPEGRVTPLARRVAARHGIDLAAVNGTGKLGRITRSDVARHAGLPEPPRRNSPAVHAPTSSPAPVQPTANPNGRRQELTRLQQVIAQRMTESKTTVPHFQVQTEADVTPVLELREELKSYADSAPTPSINDVIVKAAAIALRDHPLANGSYRDEGFELHDEINVGVAVAGEGALVVPTIFNTDQKSLGQIALETRRLAAAVREGNVAPSTLTGGTFTVSNLGMFGMTAITPVVNPPQAAILGVGATRPTLRRVDGNIIERSLITLTLSCDHRILYGADAARFLAQIRELLEAPLRLAL